jgi:hypothetical protein
MAKLTDRVCSSVCFSNICSGNGRSVWRFGAARRRCTAPDIGSDAGARRSAGLLQRPRQSRRSNGRIAESGRVTGAGCGVAVDELDSARVGRTGSGGVACACPVAERVSCRPDSALCAGRRRRPRCRWRLPTRSTAARPTRLDCLSRVGTAFATACTSACCHVVEVGR